MKKWLVILFILILHGIHVFNFFNPKAVSCFLSGKTFMFEEDYYLSDIYSSKPEVNAGNKIAAAFFKTLHSKPTIIICKNEAAYKKFAEPRTDAVTRFYSFGTFIIVKEKDINAELIAHEIIHSEIYERLGQANDELIPEWMHEAAALYLSGELERMNEYERYAIQKNTGYEFRSGYYHTKGHNKLLHINAAIMLKKLHKNGKLNSWEDLREVMLLYVK